jgi:hypothetical protein
MIIEVTGKMQSRRLAGDELPGRAQFFTQLPL